MENPEKRSTYMHCKQDEGKQSKNTTHYGHHCGKQTQIT
jgi:hypothetical protein